MDLTGRMIGRFQIRSRLGAGGMGEVYAAHDQRLKRTVAVKRLPPAAAGDSASRERFLAEARSAARISHQGIAALYDVIEEEGELFLVMEYVDGRTLKSLPLPLPLDAFLNLAIQAAEALAAAHQDGIVHGDIKPDNFMVTEEGQLKMLDFGVAGWIATAGEEDETISYLVPEPGATGGTLVYAAPEVLAGVSSDHRADFFSLGVVFYELLAAEHPFAAETPTAVAGNILHAEPAPLGEMRANVPVELQRLVGRMLQRDPTKRYASAEELLEDLAGVPAELDSGAEEMTEGFRRPERSPSSEDASRIPRWAWVAGAAAIVLLAVLGALVMGTFGGAGSSGAGTAGRGTRASVPFDAADWIIAVLPSRTSFAEDPDIAAINEGLALTLTSKLSQLSRAHSLQVIPASTLRESGIDSADKAHQDLGVTLALTFDTHSGGDRVRVNVQLIDIPGRRQIAAETIDGDLDDLLTTEEIVTIRVLRMLRLELRPMERGLLDPGTSSPRAHNYYLRGTGYLQNRFSDPDDLDVAVSLFEQALRVDPDYARAHAGLGQAFWARYMASREERWIGVAESECRAAIELDELNAEGHVCLGTVYSGTGRQAEAAAEFEIATSLDPTNDEAFKGLAAAHVANGDLEVAEETYKQAISLRPHYWGGYNELGIFYINHGRTDGAIANFEEVVQLAPDSFRGFSNLGVAYYYAERWADARRAFERALELNPDDAQTISNLGTLYFYEGRYADAARQFEAAVALSEEDSFYWWNLADAYYWAPGERSMADAAYRRAISLGEQGLRINPTDTEVLGLMAMSWAMLGDEREAVRYLTRAVDTAPEDVDVQHNAARVHLVLGHTDRALDFLQAAIDSGYPRAEIRVDPIFAAVADDPRFQRLVAERR